MNISSEVSVLLTLGLTLCIMTIGIGMIVGGPKGAGAVAMWWRKATGGAIWWTLDLILGIIVSGVSWIRRKINPPKKGKGKKKT